MDILGLNARRKALAKGVTDQDVLDAQIAANEKGGGPGSTMEDREQKRKIRAMLEMKRAHEANRAGGK